MPRAGSKHLHTSRDRAVNAKFVLSLPQLYMGERPWAGLRPVQIILKKSQGKARLTWPDGAPENYRALSERCQTTDYKQRPTFAEVRAGFTRAPMQLTARFA